MSGRRAFKRLRDAPDEDGSVHDMTPDGQGVVGMAGGKRIFVQGAISGESIRFRRVRSRRNYDEAELVAVERASPDRVKPHCEYFGTCGGCSLQHLDGGAQLRLKANVLAENLRRIGTVEPERWLEPVRGPSWGYRRRARLSVRDVAGKGRVLVGFSERGSPYVADMRNCETLHPAVARLIAPLSELIGGLSLRQRIPQVEVAVADNATVLVFRILAEPSSGDLDALRGFRDLHGLRLMLQRSGAEGIVEMDGEGEALWYEIEPGGMRLHFGATDFIQVNAEINRRMIALAVELLQPGPDSRLLDLYCGIGNFSLPLAGHAGFVLGVEGEAAAVNRARANAATNGIGNASFRCADLATADGGLAWAGQHFDRVLLDPPRAGAAGVLAAAAASGAERILYVSCHPGTLARDAGTLVGGLGYRLSAAGILDMFPSTSHVESVALFERR